MSICRFPYNFATSLLISITFHMNIGNISLVDVQICEVGVTLVACNVGF
jgi:hypothetical protein